MASGKDILLRVQLTSASPLKMTLIKSTLEREAVSRPGRGQPHKNPKRLIYDEAGGSDPLRKRLKRRGTDLICPHKSNHVKPTTQDGRKLRRYKCLWKIERSIAWIANFRRLVVLMNRVSRCIRHSSTSRASCLY